MARPFSLLYDRGQRTMVPRGGVAQPISSSTMDITRLPGQHISQMGRGGGGGDMTRVSASVKSYHSERVHNRSFVHLPYCKHAGIQCGKPPTPAMRTPAKRRRRPAQKYVLTLDGRLSTPIPLTKITGRERVSIAPDNDYNIMYLVYTNVL